MIAGAARCENRREEAARQAEDRERHGILQHREKCRTDDQYDHHGKGERQRDHRIELGRREYREIQDTERTALQDQCIAGVARAQSPADDQSGNACDKNGGQSQFNGQNLPVRCILEQKSDANEQHQNGDLYHQVAGGEVFEQHS